MTDWRALSAATRYLDAPYAVVDLDALEANAADLVRRAGGTAIRLATKSIRCRAVAEAIGARDGFAGEMAYSLPEALWLARLGATDILVAYPSVNRESLRELCDDAALASQITVMIDDLGQLDVIDASRGGEQPRCGCVSTSTPHCGLDRHTSAYVAHRCGLRPTRDGLRARSRADPRCGWSA